MENNIKILIVGSKGYIGSSLYNYLEKKKYDVFGVDNHLYGRTWFGANKQANFKKIDVRDIKKNFLKNFTHVIFLAGLSNNPIDDLFPNKAYNLVKNYTIKFAKLCKKENIKFIFPSSCSVYGYSNRRLSEKSKVNPITYYSKNKIKIEKELKKISDKNFNPIILRFATVFGYSNSLRLDLVINIFMAMFLVKKKILLNSNGMANRPHIHINDVCKAFELIVKYNNNKFEIFNVGYNNYNYKILNVALKISKSKKRIHYVGNKKSFFRDSIVRFKDKRDYIISFDKISNKFDYFSKKKIFSKDLLKFKKELKNINILDEKFIFNKNFYRLQKIKHNIKNNRSDLLLRSRT